ncbi:O-antigen ligase family protein [Microbacterium lushaniae]|nr:O-antigen ligase family protein [Microbacterium lushaniae]
MQGVLIAAAAMIVLGGLSSGQNSNLTESTTVAVTFALLVTVAPAAILFQTRRHPSFVRITVTLTLVVQTASAAAGIAQLGGIAIFGVIAREGRVNGLAYHPNVLGIMSTLAILVLLDLLRRKAARPFLLVCALGINVVALLATASLSSLITLLVGLLFFFVRLSTTAKMLSFLIAAVSLLVSLWVANGDLSVLLPEAFASRVQQVTGASAEGGVASLLVRFQTYEWAWNYITADPWVGVGMDALNQGTLTPSLVVHNYILRGWYQGGIFLLMGFILITISLLVVAMNGMRKTNLIAPSAVIGAVLAFGMTSAFYTQSHYWIPILVAAAVLNDASPVGQKTTAKERHVARMARRWANRPLSSL